ncbi:bifunctional proline dehydrogenase/L-glutamate gamma-semialdehyde dehydrogenase PutA [uncultured Algimonas sp.]|uniref:bifunctional proline dehydrogenase/L-glutamate gamma-semialdehyde dehydrogenase PutA n=1 Tax=uncultured Algimonas sp. TaxID=1547920 RepID=UPI00260AAFB4|nr:bifunctional proline dehydrogenase/L-glutamate gamma-semialdehyde dehydrogenase PutA [uncultured Algimonas sp.]
MNALRQRIRDRSRQTTADLPDASRLTDPVLRDDIQDRARTLVRHLREDSKPGLMELMLAEYGLSTDEGIALMCLAEALLRVPDSETMDDLIEDKIAPSQWGRHLGRSSSPLINSSTWALMMTGRVLDDGAPVKTTLRGMIKRLGEPVIRRAVREAMKVMGRQFVLGETIQGAIRRSSGKYRYSYDMLGEAAMSMPDADHYFGDYADAIRTLAARCNSDDIADNPGISVKLSALHPRYDAFQRDRVMDELLPRVAELAKMAADARMGFNIDAEESERLELNLDIVEALARDPLLEGWDGLGLVVQAYGPRSPAVIDWVAALAEDTGRRLMVRLVKGAYWDTEVKRAQVMGLDRYPVFETKADTDRNYILCAEKLLAARPALYPQFATHNAHTVAAVLELARNQDGQSQHGYEFQRLHGMGEALHAYLREKLDKPVRIYAPVGEHEDLLAYLVRRLLENGANSSFVAKVTDKDVGIDEIIADPFEDRHASMLPAPRDTTEPHENSRGYDLRDLMTVERMLGLSHTSSPAVNAGDESDVTRESFRTHRWDFGSGVDITDPARPDEVVGTVAFADAVATTEAIARAEPWSAAAAERARVLTAAADAMEAAAPELLALLAREAGKTAEDAIAELREAADFLRYYATFADDADEPLGTVSAIAPWNFPLAIFVGEVAGPLAAGNAVIAKPAESTPLIAMRATQILHEAGVPETALQTLPGEGAVVGAALTSDPRVDGVVFTGSTATAMAIHRSVARHLAPEAPLVAETGGINAMIVDSTALPEQAVADILASSFQSAGQRCSALRVLFVQSDIYDPFVRLLKDAMAELRLGDPWSLSTDVGPVIDDRARRGLLDYIAEHDPLFQLDGPAQGLFVPPTLIEVDGYEDVTREVFGPVLHVTRFDAEDIPSIIEAVNARDYSLTFGLHTRIDGRVEETKRALRVGNIYINRNQIGAVVGVQPFGGSALSGTGPKAGGPDYVERFTKQDVRRVDIPEAPTPDPQAVIDAAPPARLDPLSTTELPGPTGEDNQLSVYAKGKVLCLGPGEAARAAQAELAQSYGNSAVLLAADPGSLRTLDGFAVAMHWGTQDEQRACRVALSERDGPILPLIVSDDPLMLVREEHVCIDTTASGGNAQLLAAAE